MRVKVSGDPVRTDETSIVLCNHRTRLDWNFVWAAVFHAGWPNAGHSLKLVLKDNVKKIPGIGWIMQMVRCLYLKRDWKEDEGRMARMIRHWASVYATPDSDSKRSFQLLLFPEGTDLTPQTRAKSDAFAEANNRQKLK